MSDQKEVTVEVTPEDMEFRASARAAGLPDIVISMYGTALKRLVANEREACAKVCETHTVDDVLVGVGIAQSCAAAIRARSMK